MVDVHNLFLACRQGDLERVRTLAEEKDVDINSRDRWDSTPLYYSCLCGHYEVVRYLLEHGAKCEANTFDGERCLYGALSPEIRHLLRNYKVITAQTIRRELYQEFLRKLLLHREHSDITFNVHGELFHAHRCILSARSAYFAEMLTDNGKWSDRTEIAITHSLVTPEAFCAILEWLYTARLETDVDRLEDIQLLGKQCKLDDLMHRLQETLMQARMFSRTKPGTCVTTLVVEHEQDAHALRSDLGVLADEALPVELCYWVTRREMPFPTTQERTPFSDVIFDVSGTRFHCHRAFFCPRSDYFTALIRDPFHEQQHSSEPTTAPTVVRLHSVSPQIFSYVLYYVYQDAVDLNGQVAFEVLAAADLFLLPGLKRLCATYIASLLECENVVPVLRSARVFDCSRLEHQCCEFIAENLEEMAERSDFHDQILLDACCVEQREETDSIEIIDNIRYYLTATSVNDAFAKQELIDSLLRRLSLDA